ncbi:protein APEM9-like isoform X3 [Castanea sativa]|uniref:protein APEM9-like isoform X3 n=1 Tax=Castanea sativa TaxID=21020 RepID=UPI003F653559
MAVIESNPSIWEEIERSESYLVCSMYSEAESLASSILKRLCNDDDKSIVEVGFRDMLESTGMVLVQSLKALGRTSEILNQLKLLYVSVTAIPVQVLLTGACFQISDGSSFGVREFLEEFLSKWNCVDEQYYVLVGAEANVDCMARSERHFILGVDEYVEVVEVYAVTLLATVLQDMHLAISWVEKAALPEEKRQVYIYYVVLLSWNHAFTLYYNQLRLFLDFAVHVLLRKLHSLHSLKATNLSQGSSPLLADNHDGHLSSQKELNVSEVSQKALKATYPPNQGNVTKQAVLKFSERGEPYFWWFRTITLKFGNARLVISNRKVMLGCLILLMFYVLRRKKAALKRTVTRQALFLKGALVDLWKLAFSYQVNPLAAVQPLAPATRRQ